MYKGSDNMADMIRKVASNLADPAQTDLDAADSASELAIINSQQHQALAGASGRGAAVVTFTVAELQAFHPGKLHETGKIRTLDWALDEKVIDESDGLNTKARYNKYKIALEKLLTKAVPKKPAKGKGKTGPSYRPEVLKEFKAKCEEMGIKFVETRMADIAQLLAVVKARVDQLDG